MPFIGVPVGTLITLKASTTLIMVVGPIFIALALFPKTQRYFLGWGGVLGGFVLTQALFAIVLALEISFINSNVIKDGTIDTDLGTCFSIFVFFGSFIMLATEIPNYAASIMCGAPSGGVGFGVNTATQIGKTLASKLIEKGRKRGNRIS